MKNILLPTDFSKNSKNAIEYSLKLFEGETVTFHILNSQKPTGYMTADVLYGAAGDSVYDGILNDNKKELEKLIRYCETQSEGENFTFVPKIDFDNIVDAVNQAVSLNNIELIIMGTNGATGAEEVVFGSNTLKLIRKANCPVLAIPEGYVYNKIESVLLSVNSQYELKTDGLAVVLDIIRKHDATLKILNIEENNVEVDPPNGNNFDQLKDINIERFCIRKIPSAVAIDAFTQLIPVQLHAMFVERKSLLDRFIYGSETSKISYSSKVPLLIFRK
ncbi:universal stress protein [Aequorivita xiaoshiensis]|uniref:Universal stress protein n=1 Tax=Aequorivita xiaoshiensis TaxID=2874476 RepID=A0A9X1U4K2_9FLAO|nr:universal stress protein [Aequorivita xiaoshiensis]MCG2431879.1 universal stress protein [Aequorivita xiaoshiensis]